MPLLIHLPPTSEDVNSSNRDERDLTEEVLSQAQVMHNIISVQQLKFKVKSDACHAYRLRLLHMVVDFTCMQLFR